jgi:hypothetical protein
MPGSREELVSGRSAEELRKRIFRASSWEQLFPSKEEEMRDFLGLFNASKAQLESKGPLRYSIKYLSEGDLHVFECKMATFTYQKLRLSGNVAITSFYKDDSSRRTVFITPEVGNINHQFIVANTVLSEEKFLEKLVDVSSRMILRVYISGRPATIEYEDRMLGGGYLPQRIGHKIYPNFVLELQS